MGTKTPSIDRIAAEGPRMTDAYAQASCTAAGRAAFVTKDDWSGGAMLRPTVSRPVNVRVDPLEQQMDAPAYPPYAGEGLWTVLDAAAAQ